MTGLSDWHSRAVTETGMTRARTSLLSWCTRSPSVRFCSAPESKTAETEKVWLQTVAGSCMWVTREIEEVPSSSTPHSYWLALPFDHVEEVDTKCPGNLQDKHNHPSNLLQRCAGVSLVWPSHISSTELLAGRGNVWAEMEKGEVWAVACTGALPPNPTLPLLLSLAKAVIYPYGPAQETVMRGADY